MPFMFLVCSNSTICKTKVKVDMDEWQEEIKNGATTNCPKPLCSGQLNMSTTGKKKFKEHTVNTNFQANREFARKRAKRPTDGSMAIQIDSSDSENENEDDDALNDLDFLVAVTFTPSLRYTGDNMEAARLIFDRTLTTKSSGKVNIGNPIPGERQKSTKTAMDDKAAWKHAKQESAPNANKYRIGSQAYYEWCHLQADTLGGKCEKSNLVAAHYAVNTYMLCIEKFLKAKNYTVEVTAYCNKPNIADFVDYDIYNLGGTMHKKRITIDGHITKFSKANATEVEQALKTAGL